LHHQKYKNLKHILTGLIKFVVVDAKICINFTRMNRSRLTPAVTKFQPAGKRSQGHPLERLLGYIETETGHKS
jgi:methyl coenzyme M reductase alpha subunit